MANTQQVQALKSQIEQLITHCMDTGEKLPTEKEMMAQFHVSRTILREVLSRYEASGIIVTRQGSGRYVQMPNIGNHIKETWAFLLHINPRQLLELLDIRRLLEIHSLPDAMQAMTFDQLEKLKVQVDQMKTCARQGKTFAKHDREFHHILFSSTNNELLAQLLSAFWDLYASANMEIYHENLEFQANQHGDILTALVRKDLEQATKLLEEQFTDARYEILVALMDSGSTTPDES